MSKPATAALFLVALLLFSSLCIATRPIPKGFVGEEKKKEGGVMEEERCEGIGEDECLMRRSLNAHLDYIYTQNHKP